MEISESVSQGSSSNQDDSDVEMSEEDCLRYAQEQKERFEDEEVQKAARMSFAKMAIIDQLPFSSIEKQGFVRLMTEINPYFKLPTRRELIADCLKLFRERKAQIRDFLNSKGMGRVSIATECWSSVEGLDFISVTAHCVDTEWKLHRKIISFSQLESHRGEDIAAVVTSAVEEWGLRKVLCCTMNDSSENDVAIRRMKSVFDERNVAVIADGKYLHVRCVARIINSVVCEGLAEIDMSVRRVREAVKWITASTTRSELFKGLAKLYKVDASKDLCLDVPTEWNSTYLMLEAALPYERVMEGFKLPSPEFVRDLNEGQNDGDLNEKQYDSDSSEEKCDDLPVGVPEAQDWLAIKRMCRYLRKFHRLILLVTDNKCVTVHSFVKEMCNIFSIVTRLESDEDDAIKNLATKMKTELGKYWLEETELNPNMNKILYIAALLDPRQKMERVQLCLKTVYGENRANELVEELNKSINDLFDLYKKEMTLISESSSVSEITRYFTEKQYKMKESEVDDFDILEWWSMQRSRYPVLSAMARDVMAVPVSSVPCEAAFNTGGRVLSEYRSSLPPKFIEVMVCGEDWLKSSLSDVEGMGSC